MKIGILTIDAIRACCDPELYFDKSTFHYRTSEHLDRTARNIAAFMEEARDCVDSIGWATQHCSTRPGEERSYSPEESAFHHVRPILSEDVILPKTQMSPYEEHEAYFNQLKKHGVNTIVLTGFYAEHCVYWTLSDLMDNGFKVIVPTDLTASMSPHNPMYAFTDFVYEAHDGKVIFTDSAKTLDMLFENEADRTMPPPRHTWNDIHQAGFENLGL